MLVVKSEFLRALKNLLPFILISNSVWVIRSCCMKREYAILKIYKNYEYTTCIMIKYEEQCRG
jgi:hypothetical protein